MNPKDRAAAAFFGLKDLHACFYLALRTKAI